MDEHGILPSSQGLPARPNVWGYQSDSPPPRISTITVQVCIFPGQYQDVSSPCSVCFPALQLQPFLQVQRIQESLV